MGRQGFRDHRAGRASLSPVGAIARGAAAGVVGTLAFDLWLYLQYRRGGGTEPFRDWEWSADVTGWDGAPAPAQVGRRIVDPLVIGHAAGDDAPGILGELQAVAGKRAGADPVEGEAFRHRQETDAAAGDALRSLVDAGATVALGADDPLLFRARLVDQYEQARHVHGLGDAAIADLARGSIRASRASSATKERLLAGVTSRSLKGKGVTP